jgi:hypothetical protein
MSSSRKEPHGTVAARVNTDIAVRIAAKTRTHGAALNVAPKGSDAVGMVALGVAATMAALGAVDEEDSAGDRVAGLVFRWVASSPRAIYNFSSLR